MEIILTLNPGETKCVIHYQTVCFLYRVLPHRSRRRFPCDTQRPETGSSVRLRSCADVPQSEGYQGQDTAVSGRLRPARSSEASPVRRRHLSSLSSQSGRHVRRGLVSVKTCPPCFNLSIGLVAGLRLNVTLDHQFQSQHN